MDDIKFLKVDAIKSRLLSINPDADINIGAYYINEDNIKELSNKYQVAINALDFSSDIPFLFDSYMLKSDIPIIHPFNLGWAGFVTVITTESTDLQSLNKQYQNFELNVGTFITESLQTNEIETNTLTGVSKLSSSRKLN